MLHPVCYFDGRLFVWKKTSSEVLIKKFSRNENCDGCFKNEGVLSIPITWRKSRSCSMQVAGESFESLFIIAENESERKGFIVSLHSVCKENTKWSVRDVGCFQVRESIIDRIHLSQDLMLIWNNHDSFNVFCRASELGINGMRTFSTSEQLKEVLLLHNLYVGGAFNDNSNAIVLFIVAKTLASDDKGGILFYVLIFDSLNDAIGNHLHRIPTDYFIVKFYSSIISAINVTGMDIHNYGKFSTSDLIQNVEKKFNWSKNSTAVCTEKKQFIVFISGCIRYICSIPFSDVHRIIYFKTYSPVRTFFILQSLKGACAVKKCEFSKQLQICCSWEDSIAAFVGDFINSGSLQLLFISQHDPDLLTDTCVLTNIATKFYPRTSSLLQNTSCNKDAVRGIKKSVLAGQIAFSEARRKQIELQKVIEEMTQTVKFATSGYPSQRKVCDSSLVNIIPANEGPLSLITTEKNKLATAVNILATWKVLLQDQWVLGWSLSNKTDLVLSDISIHLGSENETLEYKCKYYKHLSGTEHQPNFYFDEKYSGDLKNGEHLSIVASLSLSFFAHAQLNIACIIRWKNSSSSHLSIPFSQQLALKCQLCVQTALQNRQDIFKDLSAVQQLMSLRVLQDKALLILASEHTDLSLIEKMLTLSLEHYPYALTYLSSKINIFMDPLSPLYGVNFTVNYLSSREAKSEVYYRETNQLLLFVHWFYGAIPDDVTITMEIISTDKLKRDILSSLKEELVFITSLAQRRKKVISPPMTEEINLHSLQQQSKHEREQVLKNDFSLSFQDYSDFRLSLLEKESNSDDISGQIKLYKQ